MVVAHAQDHDVHLVPEPQRRSPLSWLLAAGYLRCLWTIPMMFGIGVGIITCVRWLNGWGPVWEGSVVTTVSLITIPLGFLGGIGAFDFWLRYAIGQPTEVDDHKSHGAKDWRGYFRINTDHKSSTSAPPSCSSSSAACWR